MSYEDHYERIRPYEPERGRGAALLGCLIYGAAAGIVSCLVLAAIGIAQAIAS